MTDSDRGWLFRVVDVSLLIVVDFISFCVYHIQCLLSILFLLIFSRLSVNDTFTTDEVEDLLDGLLAVVRGEVESELINTSHSKVLLLRQLFQQSERWHLKLSADISELENR